MVIKPLNLHLVSLNPTWISYFGLVFSWTVSKNQATHAQINANTMCLMESMVLDLFGDVNFVDSWSIFGDNSSLSAVCPTATMKFQYQFNILVENDLDYTSQYISKANEKMVLPLNSSRIAEKHGSFRMVGGKLFQAASASSQLAIGSVISMPKMTNWRFFRFRRFVCSLVTT